MTSDPRQARTRSSDVSEPDQGVSKGTALLALVLIAVFLYAVRWALLPFVVSAVGAYICTPLIERFAKRTRLPRIVFVSATFIALLAAATTTVIIAVPPLVREATSTVGDLGATIERLAQGAIGDGSIEFLGKPMNASEIAQAAASGLRDWLDQTGVLLTLASWSFAGLFGTRDWVPQLPALAAAQLRAEIELSFEVLATEGHEFGYRTSAEITRFVAVHRALLGPTVMVC